MKRWDELMNFDQVMQYDLLTSDVSYSDEEVV